MAHPAAAVGAMIAAAIFFVGCACWCAHRLVVLGAGVCAGSPTADDEAHVVAPSLSAGPEGLS